MSLDRAGRMDLVLARDGAACVWCGRDFGALVVATTDHLVPRIKGGPSWLENEVAACRRCNGERGHRSPASWLVECESRGWPARRDLVAALLTELSAAIADRGGQRRARGYLESQLRRLR
jgi:HNH endonuclease